MTTVNYFKTHPLRVAKPLRDLPVKEVCSAEQASIMDTPLHPTLGAYIHYAGVELADKLVIAQPSLSQEEWGSMAYHWYQSCGLTAKQLLFYVWRIITKELRHGSLGMCDKAFSGPKWSEDSEAVKAVRWVVKSGSNYMGFTDHWPGMPVGSYVDAVEQHFRHGGWAGAYGGARWADIALVFKQYLDGMSSAMIAADRAWTLVHNTGPIFNKGFYFTMHDHSLQKVLNAQATSSVFSLGDGFTEAYPHPVCKPFHYFVAKAVKAIQSVEPDYVPGAGATGSAEVAEAVSKTGKKKKGTAGPNGLVDFGPYAYTTAERTET